MRGHLTSSECTPSIDGDPKTGKEQHSTMVRSFGVLVHEILVEHGFRSSTQERCESWYVKIFNKVGLSETPSVMKANLAWLFAKTTKQELPEITKKLRLIPPFAKKFFRDVTKNPTGPRALSFLWDLMQAKRLAAPVPKEFIEEAYKKHSRTMAKDPVPVPEWFLSEEPFFREFGRRVRQRLNFYENKLPNLKATFFEKAAGGGRALNIRKEQMSKVRTEPIYTSIHGYPGKGKSLLIHKLTRNLCKRLGFQYPEDVYVRNCAVPHWDGYKGQPICVLDDLGATGEKSTDFVDLISLVSSSCHVLPMAELEDKGTVFNSTFIFSASNYPKHVIQSAHQGGPISYAASQRRRFLTIDITRSGEIKTFRVVPQMINDVDTGLYGNGLTPAPSQPHEWFVPCELGTIDDICSDLVREFDRKNEFVQEHLSTHFSQKIYDFTVYDHGRESFTVLPGDETDPLFGGFATHYARSYSWPKEPGCQARVQTVAIPEPLKVRVITKAFAETQCLKPLQEAMWEALGTYPEFKLTHGCNPQEAVDDLVPFQGPEKLWLSGDYESATDNLSLLASQQALAWILEEIDDPIVTSWALWENGEHIVHYPSWTGIDPVQQRNGQLMGSFLSFPLLCLLNAATIRGTTPHYRINGDDLLALLTPSEKDDWWKKASSLGLIPSIGKNFFSEKFCTINSQIFWFGDQLRVGRPSLRFRAGKEIGRTFHDLCEFLGKMPKMSNYVRRNVESLRLELRSLDVPVTHGGLGKSFNKEHEEEPQMRRLVYLHDLLKDHSRSFSFSGRKFFLIKNPLVMTDASRSLAPLMKFVSSTDPISGLGELKADRLRLSDLQRVLKVVQKIPPLRDFLKNGRLFEAPPLPESGFTITTSETLSRSVWQTWARQEFRNA